MKKNKEFYDTQKELIDLAMLAMKEGLEKYRNDKRYAHLFYSKCIPPHIKQPLQALKNKIAFKPIYNKIESELSISHNSARRLVRNYGYVFIINNLDRIKELKNEHKMEVIVSELDLLM